VKVYQPLDPNISTKMRRDDVVDIDDREVIRSERFTLTFKFETVYDDTNKNTKRGDKPVHLFTVLMVKKSSALEVLRNVTSNSKLDDEAGKLFVRDVFKLESAEPNVGVPEVKILNRCSITTQLINIPGRVEDSHLGCLLHSHSDLLPRGFRQSDGEQHASLMGVHYLQTAMPQTQV
jgi:hypothetical protein